MQSNKIQRQTGLSLYDFLKSYGTESDCISRLFDMGWPTGFVCPRCEHNQYYYITTRHLYQCTMCKHQSSIISGTIFESSKIPLTT